LDTETDINVGETFFTEEKDNFVNLELQDFRFEEFKRRTIDADKTTSTLAVSDSSSGFLFQKKKISEYTLHSQSQIPSIVDQS
jgi:hypothetical protein